ncbi:MAG: FkbM family methyltransferase [Kiritimatiellia bacterium]
MNRLDKLLAFLDACRASRSLNLRGLPVWPKRLFPFLPYHRTSYNAFLCWIRKLQLPGSTWIVDAGANHGDFSEAASASFPGTNVLLFEPFPQLFPELERRCRRHHPRWILETCALGDREDTQNLYISPAHDAVGSLKGFPDSYRRTSATTDDITSIPCRVRPLDGILAERGIGRIDLLKIDVEGAEFEVLRGAENTLGNTLSVIIEVSTIRDMDQGRTALLRLLALLEEHRFRTVAVLPSLYSRKDPWLPADFNVLARKDPG